MRQIFIIGAARSGTKILRDSLGQAYGIGVVPYDIEYIWRYGRESSQLHDDAFRPGEVDEEARRYIRTFIQRYGLGYEAVVEKTVANTLRVPFVKEVFPDAQFVHLIRDGVDVVQSAVREWTAPVDVAYLTRKLRHFPPRFLPRYGVEFAIRTLRRSSSGEPQVWGPRYPDVERDLALEPLEIICARQWRFSVEAALNGFAELGSKPTTVRYEDFVNDPNATLARLGEVLGLRTRDDAISAVAANVRRGQPRMKPLDGRIMTERLADELNSTLSRLGYGSV